MAKLEALYYRELESILKFIKNNQFYFAVLRFFSNFAS